MNVARNTSKVQKLPKPDTKDAKRMVEFYWQVYALLVDFAKELDRLSDEIEKLKNERRW